MVTHDFPLQPPIKKQSSYLDRISSLPDAVLCHILSFVTPAKYTIRTTVLSKRWKNLWASASKFDLELDPHCIFKGNKDQFESFEELCVNTFTHSVDNLLFHQDYLHIESIRLCFGGNLKSFHLRPCSWLCAILKSNNVCKLNLEIGDLDNKLGELPLCLYTCKTIVVLKLCGKFILNVPHYVCLPNLKTLHLEGLKYSWDAKIQKFLSGCPILEDLQITRYPFDQTWVVNVRLLPLRRLRLWFDNPIIYIDEDDYLEKVVVDAPNLEFIDLRDIWSDNILFKDLPNIVEARIDVKDVYPNMLVLLQRIANVRRLFLYEDTLRILSFDNAPALPTFCNLVQLELCYANDPIHFMDFLHCSPKLEAISFPIGIYSLERNVDPRFLENNPEQVPECLRHTLKTVKIKQFFGVKNERYIVKYLLKHAMEPEKITISITSWLPPTSPKFI